MACQKNITYPALKFGLCNNLTMYYIESDNALHGREVWSHKIISSLEWFLNGCRNETLTYYPWQLIQTKTEFQCRAYSIIRQAIRALYWVNNKTIISITSMFILVK